MTISNSSATNAEVKEIQSSLPKKVSMLSVFWFDPGLLCASRPHLHTYDWIRWLVNLYIFAALSLQSFGCHSVLTVL